MTHTPGPWHVGRDTDTDLPVILAGPCIAALTKWSGIGESNLGVIKANANLIAAAPEMLAALESLVAQILDYERVNNLAPNPGRKYCWDATERAVAAITKAAAGE